MLLLNSVSDDAVGGAMVGDGSDVAVAVEAVSFGGGYVRLEMRRPGGNVWIPVTVASDLSPAPVYEITSNSVFPINVPIGYELRAVLVGSTGANGVTVAVDN